MVFECLICLLSKVTFVVGFLALSLLLSSCLIFLVCLDHLILRSVLHWLAENVVCIQMDCDHDVAIASLRGVWKCTCLVGVDALGQVLDVDKYVVVAFCW